MRESPFRVATATIEPFEARERLGLCHILLDYISTSMDTLAEEIASLLPNGLGARGDEERNPLTYPARSLHVLLATSGSVASIKAPVIVRELLKVCPCAISPSKKAHEASRDPVRAGRRSDRCDQVFAALFRLEGFGGGTWWSSQGVDRRRRVGSEY